MFVVVLAVLEQMGMPDQWIGYAFVLLTIGVYAGIGYMSRTAQVSEYYVAGRRVPAMYNGMATAADWMSAASFIGMAGSLYLQGYDGLAFVLGWTGGYVLVAVLVAPYLRKFGAYTVPDFLAARYEGNLARFMGVVVLIACSFIYLMGQLTGTGLVMSRLIGIPFEYGVFVGLAGILVCSMLGGMRAVTWTQVAQYIVLIIAYLIPVIILSTQTTGVPVPQLMYGGVLQEVTNLERTAPYIAPFVGEAKGHATAFWFRDPLNFFGLIFCLMLGTASLPHVIMRYFTTPSVREARKSVGWSLLFIFILYFTAPAYAVFAKYEVFTNVLGKDLGDPGGGGGTPGLDLHLRQAGAGEDLRRRRREPGCGVRGLPGLQGCSRRGGAGDPAHLQPVHHRRRHDRPGDPGDRGPALRDRGPRRRRRPRRCAVDRGRPAARDRQRAQPRRLLPDGRPHRLDQAPPDRGPHAAHRRGAAGCLDGDHAAADAS